MEVEIKSWDVGVIPTVVRPGDRVTMRISVYPGSGDTPVRCSARIHWIDGTTWRTSEFYVYPESGGSVTKDLYVPTNITPGTYTVTVELYKYSATPTYSEVPGEHEVVVV